MKKQIQDLKLCLPALLMLSALASNAQVNPQGTHTLTTTNVNIIASRAKIDLTDLNGKPDAIIVATAVGNSKTINPHPNGAWYYGGKWNFFNSDHISLVVGLSYNLTYFVNAGPDQFLHAVTQQNLGFDGSYITHPKLDNNPNAQFAFFQNHSPDLRPGSVLNQFEEKIGYSAAAKKWYITNVSNIHPMVKGAYYNIVISPGPTVVTTPILVSGAVVNTTPTVNPTNNSSTQPCNCPASLPPNGLAGGDLVGPYPDPMVGKILGRSLSNTAPTVGQVLKWNGNEWGPAEDNAGSNPGTSNTIKTYYKYTPHTQSTMEIRTVQTETKIPSISGLVIPVTGPSTLVISASCYASAECPAIGSCPITIEFYYKVNNNTSTVHSYAGAEYLTALISNHFYDVAAGTYTIDFYSRKRTFSSQLGYSAAGGYVTVMVLPK